MGWLTTVIGHPPPTPSHADRLSTLVAAADRLRRARGFTFTGVVAIAIPTSSAGSLAALVARLRAEVTVDGAAIGTENDEFGCSWLVITVDPPEPAALSMMCAPCLDALDDAGLLADALCAVVSFEDAAGRLLGLIYLFETRAFHPFVPVAASEPARDNLTELMVRDLVDEVGIERDVSTWFPVWNAPGMRLAR